MGNATKEENPWRTILAQFVKIGSFLLDDKRSIYDVIRWNQVVIADPDFVKVLDAPRAAVKKEVEPVLLRLVSMITVPAMTGSRKASELFVVDASESARVKISYVDPTFLTLFGEMMIGPSAGATLSYHTLTRRAYDRDIHAALGGRDKCVTTLSDLWWLMEQQPKGVGDVLLADGSANIFYIYDGFSALRAVGVRWDDGGWHVSVYVLVCYYWDERRRVFAPAACVPVGNS